MMAKINTVAITNAAQAAGTRLAAWGAIEAEMKNRVAEAEGNTAPDANFVEVHIVGSSAQAVVKIGASVLRLSN